MMAAAGEESGIGNVPTISHCPPGLRVERRVCTFLAHTVQESHDGPDQILRLEFDKSILIRQLQTVPRGPVLGIPPSDSAVGDATSAPTAQLAKTSMPRAGAS